MKSEFELIQYNNSLPAKIELKQGKIAVNPHWHKEIELLYVPEGTLTVMVNAEPQTISADGVFLVNSSENHSLSAEQAKCLILDISYEFVQQFNEPMQNTSFEIVGGSGAEEEIRNLLWQLSRTIDNGELPELRQHSLITELLHVLLVQCRRKAQNTADSGEQISSRHVRTTVEYIKKHFREDIEENEIAEMLGLHPMYLCALFKQETGVGFRDYLLKIRLEHAMDALMNRQMSIDEAAKAGGFPSTRTFIAKCKRAYNITPFQLLKQQREVKS